MLVELKYKCVKLSFRSVLYFCWGAGAAHTNYKHAWSFLTQHTLLAYWTFEWFNVLTKIKVQMI
jgi:hypothetical protein